MAKLGSTNIYGDLTVSGYLNKGEPVLCRAYLSSAVSMNGFTDIPFDRVSFDTAGCFDTSNHWFKPNVSGYYRISLLVNVDAQVSDKNIDIRFKDDTNPDSPVILVRFKQKTGSQYELGDVSYGFTDLRYLTAGHHYIFDIYTSDDKDITPLDEFTFCTFELVTRA